MSVAIEIRRIDAHRQPHIYMYIDRELQLETATQKERDRSQLSINADAFMHPIVNAYRFDEAMAMFKDCELYRSLTRLDQLRVIELLMKPTGFIVLAGKKESYKKLGQRIAGNLIAKEALPDPYPRLLRV